MKTLLTTSLFLCGLIAISLSADTKPNILLIAVDDLKPLLGCYGNPVVQSPNIDRLAAHGTTFLNAHCQQAVCGPSRASLLTGLRPDSTGIWDLKTKIRKVNPDVVTLPQHFKNNGYNAIGIGKIFDFRSVQGHEKDDPQSWSRPYELFPTNPDEQFGCVNPDYVAQTRNRIQEMKNAGTLDWSKLRVELGGTPAYEGTEDVPDEAYDDGRIAQRALELLDELTVVDEPFFLAVGFKKPHLPFIAPKKYWDLYNPSSFLPHPITEKPEGAPNYHHQPGWELRNGSYSGVPLLKDPSPIPDETAVTLIHGYYACVSYVDAQIGKLLDRLQASGKAENTIIVFWGDHGFHLGDHGMWCKHTNYEQSTRSPMIIVDPRKGTAGRNNRSESLVEFVDFFPTLTGLAGLPMLDVLEGDDLTPILTKPETIIKEVAVSQFPRTYEGREIMGYAYRSQRYRLIEWEDKRFRNGEQNGPIIDIELYDYAADPMETRNLASDPAYAEVLAEIQALAEAHKAKYRKT